MSAARKNIALTIGLYLLLGSAWILGTDFFLGRFSSGFDSIIVWQTVKGLVFVLGTAVFFYVAMRSNAAKGTVAAALLEGASADSPDRKGLSSTSYLRPWAPLGIFLVMILVLAASGAAVYLQASRTVRANARTALRNVAGLKARQVDAWRKERLGDARTITYDPVVMASFRAWLADPAGRTAAPERILRRLDAFRKAYGYHALLLFDSRGVLRVGRSDHEAVFTGNALLKKALQQGRPIFSAAYVPQDGCPQVVDFVVPLHAEVASGAEVFGALVFRMALENELFPDPQWLPADIQGAETFLVQREAGAVPLGVPLSRDAGRGPVVNPDQQGESFHSFFLRALRQGQADIVDHHGVPVLAVLEKVPDSDWLVLAKVNRVEVERPLKRLGAASGMAVLFLIAASAAGIVLWWRQQMAGFAVARLREQLQRQALRKHLEYLTRFANDIILLLDGDGTVVEANDRAISSYGYPREELIGKHVRELRAPDTLGDFDARWKDAYDGGVLFDTVHRRADGSCFPVEVSARRVEADGRVWCQSIIRDISERKHAEQRIQNLTRLYNVLSQTNQAIVRHVDKQALFEDICNIAVELGGLCMALITVLEPHGENCSVAASCGADPALLDVIPEHTLHEFGGRKEAPRTLLSGGSVICNQAAAGASDERVKGVLRRCGIGSFGLFPLYRGDSIFGTLNLYSTTDDFFGKDMVAVLEEMAGDITFALNTFDKEMARKKAEERLQKTSATLTAVFQATPLPVIINDLEGRVLFWNAAAETVFGWSEKEALGKAPPFVPKEKQGEFHRNLASAKSGNSLRGVEIQRRRRDGRLLDMLLFTAPLHDVSGRIENTVALFMDITEQKRAREHILCLAHYDQLTGLGNRTLLRERFAQEASRAQRAKRHLALCLIDLDKFKSVNDALGHALGDMLLVQVARRLEECLRRADVISRLGGDEFLVLLTDLERPQDTVRIADKVLGALTRPFSLEGHTVRISASMGIGFFPEDGEDFDTLFRKTDTAMYAAKEKGRDKFMFFHGEMDQKIRARLDLENSLRNALEHKAFFLHYQPQVDILTGRIEGVEALLRFRHPERGLIPPDSFIPVAEDSGLIVPLGEWILEEACRQLRFWREAGLTDLTMAVNLSPVQIFQEDFAGRTEAILKARGIHPGLLNLELTESIFMEEDERVHHTLLTLKKMGVRIALDDFGTGYSSLSYLKRYAVDEIKIDRSFVRDVCSDPGDAAIVLATIQMARSLGLQTVAEGVETAEQLAFLRAHGCDRYQGYLCSRPLVADALAQLVEGGHDKLDPWIPGV